MSLERTAFSFPAAVRYGPGTVAELPGWLQRAGLARSLVVTDAGLAETEAFRRLENALGKEQRDRRWWVYSGVRPNPPEQNVLDAARTYAEHRCDAVIGFGGGSALDVAKAIRLLVRRPGRALADFEGDGEEDGELAPYVAIPTTAGTGSEVGRSAVIILQKSQRKAVIFHPGLLARWVILDPELTLTLPGPLTAATGLDALTHCIESFTSPVFQPLCDGIALEGIHLTVDALPRAYENGADLEARGKMLVAAAMGAVAFQKDLGATHALAHPLSALCGMHHGTANALCLPPVMEFNARRKPGLYRRIGLACGLDVLKCDAHEADQRTVAFVRGLIQRLGLTFGLRNQGVTEGQVQALTEQAFADGCHRTNPVAVTADDLARLYRAAL